MFHPISRFLFCLFLLLTLPKLSSAQDGEGASGQINDIRIINESGGESNVSTETIKKRILYGEQVHFAENQKEGKRRVNPEWISEAVKAGVEKIDITGAIITGNLDLSCPSFRGNVDFTGTTFQGRVDFEAANFQNAHFAAAKFEGRAYFNKAEFNDAANFYAAKFNDRAFFTKSKCKKADFNKAVFRGWADFCGAESVNVAGFAGVKFYNGADFSSAKFNKADFKGATFLDKATFEAATFLGRVNFNRTTFEKEALFYRARFAGDVDLSLASYSGLRISWRQLEGHLDGSLSDILNSIPSKPVTLDSFVLWQEVYLKLIRNFENMGDTQSADNAYYYYRWKKPYFNTEPNGGYIIRLNWWWKMGEYIIINFPCGYGVRPWRPLRAGLVLILIFSVYYFLYKVSLEYEGKEKDSLKKSLYCLWWECFHFSVTSFTSIGHREPLYWNNHFKWSSMTEGILGWLTMALFLVTLANVWLR